MNPHNRFAQMDEGTAFMASIVDEVIAEVRAEQEAGPEMVCPPCEGAGYIETQPLYGIDAYWPTGAPRCDEETCGACGGSGWLPDTEPPAAVQIAAWEIEDRGRL